jgi:hypothetical protein
MTALQHEPSAHAPWTRMMFGREFKVIVHFLSAGAASNVVVSF